MAEEVGLVKLDLQGTIFHRHGTGWLACHVDRSYLRLIAISQNDPRFTAVFST
jgi:hypothetical protein